MLRTAAVFTCLLAVFVNGAVYHVTVDGIDDAGRDGASVGAAWKTLAYACERVSGPGDTIRLGEGTFVETRTAELHDGLTILGVDSAATLVQGAGAWELSGRRRDIENNRYNYIIAGYKTDSVTIADIGFSSADTTDTLRLLHGAIWFMSSEHITVRNCSFTQFAWAGFCVNRSGYIDVHDCRFFNACRLKDGVVGGQITVKWINNSIIQRNTIIRTAGAARGYKSLDAGHRNVTIRDNYIAGHYFSIESPHDHERNFEICYNELEGCISIPKFEGGYTVLPDSVDFAIRIHHNILHDSYGVEGPRNHLYIDSNYVVITKTGGRFYTQHQASVCLGPVWIRGNVIVNIDRGFVWAHNAGKAKNFHIYNNTVYCADAQDRTGPVLGVPDSAENWAFHNNIVIAPPERPRVLYGNIEKGERVVTATHNVFVNVSNVPEGNFSDVDPGLALAGEKPYPWYAPAGAASFVVDKGTDVGLPWLGAAPDIGAYEFESNPVGPRHNSPRERPFTVVPPGAAVIYSLQGRVLPDVGVPGPTAGGMSVHGVSGTGTMVPLSLEPRHR